MDVPSSSCFLVHISTFILWSFMFFTFSLIERHFALHKVETISSLQLHICGKFHYSALNCESSMLSCKHKNRALKYMRIFVTSASPFKK
jgi:hypothetical protein